MAMVEAALKSPSIPLSKGGIYSVGLKPLFGKEGKGRFLGGVRGDDVANF
jgi:hypothetical protein